jgi:hypothetical protein
MAGDNIFDNVTCLQISLHLHMIQLIVV